VALLLLWLLFLKSPALQQGQLAVILQAGVCQQQQQQRLQSLKQQQQPSLLLLLQLRNLAS
jgi:hypothetical protein